MDRKKFKWEFSETEGSEVFNIFEMKPSEDGKSKEPGRKIAEAYDFKDAVNITEAHNAFVN